MKRLLVGIVAGGILLVACTAPVEQTDAKSEDIWEVIGTQEISGRIVTELRHIESGCHSVYMTSADGTFYEPMFKANMSGTQMPYCTDK